MGDGDHPTNDYLRSLKQKPRPELIAFGWPWKTEQVVFLVGGAVLFSERNVLRLTGAQVLSSHRRCIKGRDFVRFDLQLTDPKGETFLTMTDNSFRAHTAKLNDLIFTPQAKNFSVSHKSGVSLSLRSDHLTPKELLERVPSEITDSVERHLSLVRGEAVDSDGKLSLVTVTGRLHGPRGDLELTEHHSQLRLRGWPASDPISLYRAVYPKGTAMKFVVDQREYLLFG